MVFKPKVSIIIPVYNGSNYLKEAIDSALSQTYKNVEILVINDGSNDRGKTEKICKSYGNKIRYFKKENGGVASALNLGIEEMKGEYFSWLSHDDVYYPEKIEKQIEFLSKLKEKKKVILFANFELMDKDSQFIRQDILDHEELSLKPEYALLRGCINGITLLIPKTAFEKHGNFNESLRCTQDYDLWMKFMQSYSFVHMETFITKTRIHPAQDTVSNPKVIYEGNQLWISMMKSVSMKRKKELEGSVYNFYEGMVNHLSKSDYKKAERYAFNKADDIFKKKLDLLSEKDKLISVIIPCYNQGKYLDEAVSSILDQTYRHFEIIIVDDGSTDEYTKKILKNYSKPKTKVYFTKNHGAADARNYGFSKAKGSFVQFLDADDFLRKDKFEKQIKILLCDTKIDVCYSSYQYFIDSTKEYYGPEFPLQLSENPLEDFLYCWQRSLSIPIHAPLFRKSIWGSNLPFVAHWGGAEDWLMWIYLASRGHKFKRLNDVLAIYRLQKHNTTKNSLYMFYWSCRAISYIAEHYISQQDIKKFNLEQSKYLENLARILFGVNYLESEVNNLREENARIVNSFTWRVTKPFRKVCRLFFLFRTQGVRTTLRNIKLKIKSKK